MALTTLEYVLQGINQLGSVTASESARYDQLRQSVEAAVKSYLKWDVEQVVGQIDYYSGTGQPNLILRQPWVSAITDVWVDYSGAWGQRAGGFSDDPLENGIDYSLRYDGNRGATDYGKSGLLVALRGSALMMPSDYFFNQWGRGGGLSYFGPAGWSGGNGNIKVELSYGFPPGSIPLDIQQAVVTAVAIFNNSSQYGAMVSSESLARYSYSLALGQEAAFGSVRQLLSRWRDSSL